MKKVIEISIGGINFSMDDDAYFILKDYLTRFENTIHDKNEAKEVMEDVEARVADLLQKEKRFEAQVVSIDMVRTVIDYLGEVEENRKSYSSEANFGQEREDDDRFSKSTKRFYRNPDDKKIAGVCSGIAAYFNMDVTIVRVLFFVALLCYGSALMLYVILWIVTTEAITVTQKLEMRGIPVTAENIRKYSAKGR